MNRVERLRTIMNKEGLDAFLITSNYNRFYLSKFTGSTATIIITKNGAYFITDFRYTEQAKEQAVGYDVMIVNSQKGYAHYINEIFAKDEVKVCGFEGDNMTYDAYKLYEERLAPVSLKSVSLINLRSVKDEEELATMKKAAEIAEEAFDYVVKNVIKVGVSEIECNNALVGKMKELGATHESFDSIVASGARGSLPHGAASSKLIEEGDFVTFDFGALYKGYCSDITRTIVVGENYDPKIKEIYDIVKNANELGIKSVKPGMKACEVDTIVRDYIASFGYGPNFGHSLGHGLGINVHEAPGVGYNNQTILEEGMVITIEPGIYIEGLGGVRIEDDVVVTKDGCRVITSYPKELIIVK